MLNWWQLNQVWWRFGLLFHNPYTRPQEGLEQGMFKSLFSGFFLVVLVLNWCCFGGRTIRFWSEIGDSCVALIQAVFKAH